MKRKRSFLYEGAKDSQRNRTKKKGVKKTAGSTVGILRGGHPAEGKTGATKDEVAQREQTSAFPWHVTFLTWRKRKKKAYEDPRTGFQPRRTTIGI